MLLSHPPPLAAPPYPPTIYPEIAERRLWDISASERLDILKDFVSHGLEHWGTDGRGVETTRRFLLEWLSFTHRCGVMRTAPTTPQPPVCPPSPLGHHLMF